MSNRRCCAGPVFEVWNLPEARGSYEEVPTNILDFVARDRRWCQGNLQHLRLVGMPGLPLTCRLQLALGALAYISSALWLLLLAAGMLTLVGAALGAGHGTIAAWQVSRPGQSLTLLGITLAMLLLPKLLAVTLVLFDPAQRRGYGGARPLLFSAACEVVLTAVLAPVLMLHHSVLMSKILAGRGVEWRRQHRTSRALGLAEALAQHRSHAALGALLTVCILLLAPRPALIWWFTPVLAGLLLAVPLAVLGSLPELGRRLRRRGLFLIPEETAPPAELARLGGAPAQRQAA